MGLQQQKCSDLLSKYNPSDFDPGSDDRLMLLVRNQISFRDLLDKNRSGRLNDIKISKLICEQMEALTHECAELRELLAWKAWRKYPKNFEIDRVEAGFEVADMMCFLINIAIRLGMDGQELFRYTLAKQMHNVERQKDAKYGYISKADNGKKEKRKITNAKKTSKRR